MQMWIARAAPCGAWRSCSRPWRGPRTCVSEQERDALTEQGIARGRRPAIAGLQPASRAIGRAGCQPRCQPVRHGRPSRRRRLLVLHRHGVHGRRGQGSGRFHDTAAGALGSIRSIRAGVAVMVGTGGAVRDRAAAHGAGARITPRSSGPGKGRQRQRDQNGNTAQAHGHLASPQYHEPVGPCQCARLCPPARTCGPCARAHDPAVCRTVRVAVTVGAALAPGTCALLRMLLGTRALPRPCAGTVRCVPDACVDAWRALPRCRELPRSSWL